MVLDSNYFMFSLRYWNHTLKPVSSNRKVMGGFKTVPLLAGSWLCAAGTVSLVGSGGLACHLMRAPFFVFFFNLTYWAVTLGLKDVRFCNLCNFIGPQSSPLFLLSCRALLVCLSHFHFQRETSLRKE